MRDRPTCVRVGNLVLAEHARTHPWTPLPERRERRRYWPQLPWPDLSRTLGVRDERTASAAACLAPRNRAPRAAIALRVGPTAAVEYWQARHTLLDCDGFTRAFVVETESDGSARLRFGDGTHGMIPPPGVPIHVQARTGVGSAGNIAAGSLRHLVAPPAGIALATNVAPAQGGEDAAPLAAIRLHAPEHYQLNDRAVTCEDYIRCARAVPGVAGAAASLGSTGSGPLASVWITGGSWPAATADLLAAVRTALELRMPAGTALDVRAATPSPAMVELAVTVLAGWSLTLVGGAIDAALASTFLDPRHFTFETELHQSDLIATVADVDGVADVTVVRLHWSRTAAGGRIHDTLTPRRGAIIRVDGGAGAPSNGRLEYRIGGLGG